MWPYNLVSMLIKTTQRASRQSTRTCLDMDPMTTAQLKIGVRIHSRCTANLITQTTFGTHKTAVLVSTGQHWVLPAHIRHAYSVTCVWTQVGCVSTLIYIIFPVRSNSVHVNTQQWRKHIQQQHNKCHLCGRRYWCYWCENDVHVFCTHWLVGSEVCDCCCEHLLPKILEMSKGIRYGASGVRSK